MRRKKATDGICSFGSRRQSPKKSARIGHRAHSGYWSCLWCGRNVFPTQQHLSMNWRRSGPMFEMSKILYAAQGFETSSPLLQRHVNPLEGRQVDCWGSRDVEPVAMLFLVCHRSACDDGSRMRLKTPGWAEPARSEVRSCLF